MAYPSSHLLFPFLFYLISFTSSAFSDQLSSSFASTQIKFWSQNVNNKIPAAIFNKLSPLTVQDSDYYTKAISQDDFKADAKFCSLAKLTCFIDEVTAGVDNRIHGVAYNRDTTATVPLEKVDPFSYFRLSVLKEGYTIHLQNLKEPFTRAFLPPQITSKISFSTTGITKVFPEHCGDAISTSISLCNAAAMKGETKACAKSLEEMISFSKTVLGKSKLLAFSSKIAARSGNELTIKKVERYNVEKVLVCHQLFLPFATYACHSLPSTRLYSIEFVEPKTGAPVGTVMATCHMDTSTWSPNHTALRLLKIGPGQGEACHYLNEDSLAWIADDGKNI